VIRKPYYNINQILTGLYTAGSEYVTSTGLDYIGEYHITPNDKKYSGSQPSEKSIELFDKKIKNIDYNVINYNTITQKEINRYTYPIPYIPTPDDEDYINGKMERFFVQKRNDLRNIIEIGVDQYNNLNFKNNPGINSSIWNSIKIIWSISNLPKSSIERLNSYEINSNSNNFPYLNFYLKNLTELYKNIY
jgi:hypothetical protein